MCGICGIYNLGGGAPDGALLDEMNSRLRHRGPDGSGTYLSKTVALGHRRLSIIDIDGGGQPMTNEGGDVHLVFNGEIYNYLEIREELVKKGHIFKTSSDTEVIVHGYEQWGLDCVNRFNGVFAFALWDNALERLFLARDHLGVKPLYYSLIKGRLLFASEIKAILAEKDCPREVDIEALGRLFTFRYVPSPSTLFNGIKKLRPGHLMTADRDGMEVKRYWEWRPGIVSGQSEKDLIEVYRSLVEDSVRLQLASDVPVGLFLSSGIDSCAILSIASRLLKQPLYTFTIGFEGGERTNETDDARKIARMYGAEHTEMIVGPGDYEKYYERYLEDIEEPLGNETAAAFYFVSLLASGKVKVALTGQGADEPWAGYYRHIGVKLSNVYGRLPSFITEDILKRAVYALPRNERLKRGVASLSERDILTRFARIYSFFSREMREELFKDWMKALTHIEEAKEALRYLHSDVDSLDPLTQMLYIDTRSNLPDDLLMAADKTSMANSIEARVPFLDYRIVEFIETLPPGLKLRWFKGKYLHKKAVEKWLPLEMIHKKKKGFENPVDQWLRTRMRSYVNDCLLSENAAVNKYFDREYIKNILRLHGENKEDYLRQIYLLVSFELWHQRFIN